MKRGRFRIFRGEPTRLKLGDGDTLDGTGEALRACHDLDDEGDETIRSLLRRLDEWDTQRAGKGG
jgi:hypothetical protein